MALTAIIETPITIWTARRRQWPLTCGGPDPGPGSPRSGAPAARSGCAGCGDEGARSGVRGMPASQVLATHPRHAGCSARYAANSRRRGWPAAWIEQEFDRGVEEIVEPPEFRRDVLGESLPVFKLIAQLLPVVIDESPNPNTAGAERPDAED